MLALIRLDASWCTKLPDTAVEALVATCLSLEHLGLKGCSALISPSVHSANLRNLDLSLCGNLVRCGVLVDLVIPSMVVVKGVTSTWRFGLYQPCFHIESLAGDDRSD